MAVDPKKKESGEYTVEFVREQTDATKKLIERLKRRGREEDGRKDDRGR